MEYGRGKFTRRSPRWRPKAKTMEVGRVSGYAGHVPDIAATPGVNTASYAQWRFEYDNDPKVAVRRAARERRAAAEAATAVTYEFEEDDTRGFDAGTGRAWTPPPPSEGARGRVPGYAGHTQGLQDVVGTSSNSFVANHWHKSSHVDHTHTEEARSIIATAAPYVGKQFKHSKADVCIAGYRGHLPGQVAVVGL